MTSRSTGRGPITETLVSLDTKRVLVPFGGGIDSVVTVESLSPDLDTSLFIVSPSTGRFAPLEATAAHNRATDRARHPPPRPATPDRRGRLFPRPRPGDGDDHFAVRHRGSGLRSRRRGNEQRALGLDTQPCVVMALTSITSGASPSPPKSSSPTRSTSDWAITSRWRASCARAARSGSPRSSVNCPQYHHVFRSCNRAFRQSVRPAAKRGAVSAISACSSTWF